MSTAGCYSLDVYCDYQDYPAHCRASEQFTGRTETDCLREAKRAGWSIGQQGKAEDNSRPARCPNHRHRRPVYG